MRSSIFSSKSAALLYAKGLLGICAILVVGLELLSHYLLKNHSQTYVRVSRQYANALEIRPGKPGEPKSVLMVGNSLLMEAIELDRLQELTSGSMRIDPIFLEATGYYDWLYGLRRLFRQGARPQVVVLGVGVSNFFSNSVRQDYAPMMFFDARDVLAVASDLNLDRTATSNLLLAHSSAFWDARSVIRTQVLSHLVPDFQRLWMIAKTQPAVPHDSAYKAIAISRLRTLRELCQAHGARLIILIPPTPSSESAVREMVAASQMVGVETLVPIDPATFSARFYEPDEIHLNAEGAALFTSTLGTDLPKKIADAEVVTSPD